MPISTITVEIAAGPASIGIPSGMIPASAFDAPSAASSGVSFVVDLFAWRLSMPIYMRMIPPAILNAGSVMPKRRKRRLPATAKPSSVRV
jgi:hypothetical protein